MEEIIYMKVTMDKYELPLAVADTVVELARIVGAKPNTISSGISKSKSLGIRSQYVKVVIQDET